MIERLGARKYALPALAAILISCVMALMFYPMLNMSPRDLPFAVLSLDEGATTPQGEMNAGELMVKNLTNTATPGNADSPIQWQVVENQEELDAALANNEYFGALTIPANFTQGQVAAQMGEGEPPSINVVIDNAKSPIMAMQMQQLMGSMFSQMDISASVELIHAGDASASPTSPFAVLMGQQIAVMPLIMMSIIGSVLLTRIFKTKNAPSAGERLKVVGKQLAYAAGLSLLAALLTTWILNGLVGVAAPFWTMSVFLWFASFTIMALFIGAFDIHIAVGALLLILVIFCGMMTAVLPPEALPGFWANWIYPWVPQHFVGQGIRDILFMGAGLMPRGTGGLLITGGIGLVITLVSAFIPTRASKETTQLLETDAEAVPA